MPGKRKPAALKILQGTFRKDQEPEREAEISPTTLRKPPAYLNRWAKALWNEVAQELVDSGIVTAVDWTELTKCCDFHGLYMEAREAILTKIDEDGNKVPRSLREYLVGRNSQTATELSALRSFHEMYKSAASNLGLNPVARNHIDLKKDKTDEISEIEKQWTEVNG